MTDSRLQKLQAMLKEDPNDPLLQYMLALELDKVGEHDRSLELLKGLTQADPPYVPAFVMAGQQLAVIGRTEEARSMWESGVQEARRQNNDHAAEEMTQFLSELPYS